jgi:hypothetical protein
MEKVIVTTCPFPLIKMDVKLKYAEVRKPTGVGYIILELIKDAKKRDERLTEILTGFGVPEDLLCIFADDVERLLKWGILRLVTDSEYNREYFDGYTVGHFRFTENGERMFREGAVPTGEEKTKVTAVYFNPLTSEFLFKNLNKCGNIKAAYCYADGFMDKVKTDFSRLKEFLIDNSVVAGLQKEERLLEHAIDASSREDLATTEDENLNLRIDEDGIEVNFKTAGAMDFYKTYFTPDMLERNLAAKNKFKFPTRVSVHKANGFSEFKNLSALYLPEEYSKQIDRQVKLLVTRGGGNIVVKHGKTATSFEQGKTIDTAIGDICPKWSFITIDAKEMRAYTAAETELIERRLNKPMAVNLLIEQVFGTEQKRAIVKAIYDECKAVGFSEECCRLVKAVADLLENAEMANEYTRHSLWNNKDAAVEERCKILLAANGVFKDIQKWVSVATDCANEIYNRLIDEMTEENVGYTVKMARLLDGIRTPRKGELLDNVAKKLETLGKIDTIEMFNILSSAGFNENEALSVANAVKIYVDKIINGETVWTDRSGLSGKFEAPAHDLSELKKNLGIESTAKYAFREGYDQTAFINYFKAFQSKLDGLKKYEGFAPEGFKALHRYVEIMRPAFDYIMVERNASQNPEKIDRKYIHSKIAAGDWRSAIGEMTIRLEYMLGKRLDAGKSGDGGKPEALFERIKRAVAKKILTSEEANTLHKLREFRNRLYHPTMDQLDFNRENIDKWADAVFALDGNGMDKPSGGKK